MSPARDSSRNAPDYPQGGGVRRATGRDSGVGRPVEGTRQSRGLLSGPTGVTAVPGGGECVCRTPVSRDVPTWSLGSRVVGERTRRRNHGLRACNERREGWWAGHLSYPAHR